MSKVSLTNNFRRRNTDSMKWELKTCCQSKMKNYKSIDKAKKKLKCRLQNEKYENSLVKAITRN